MPAFAHPAFAPYAGLVAALELERGHPAHSALDEQARARGVVNARGLPLRFNAPDGHLAARDYERRIFDSGCISTRPGNWHDTLNALVWLRFPRLKAALNAAHIAAMGDETGPLRNRRRDALTLLDESGILLAQRDPRLVALLAAREWETLFVTRRAEVSARLEFVVVGHALLEKLFSPWPGVTGKCLALPAGADLETAAVAALPDLFDPRTLPPLPVAGVPGWDAANSAPAFYANREVFRPLK